MNLASAPELLARLHCLDQCDDANEIWISSEIPKRSNNSEKVVRTERFENPCYINAAVRSQILSHPAIFLQSAEVDVTKTGSKSVVYENRTKSAKCGGLETIGPRERKSGSNGLTAVRRLVAKGRG
jgi:hypothetical protein